MRRYSDAEAGRRVHPAGAEAGRHDGDELVHESAREPGLGQVVGGYSAAGDPVPGPDGHVVAERRQ